jgi:hypothetical protein
MVQRDQQEYRELEPVQGATGGRAIGANGEVAFHFKQSNIPYPVTDRSLAFGSTNFQCLLFT